MKFFGWAFDPKERAWQKGCVSSYKSDAQAYVSLLLDERRQPERFGLVLMAGRAPSHSPGRERDNPASGGLAAAHSWPADASSSSVSRVSSVMEATARGVRDAAACVFGVT
jgi:hypothetical protein